MSSTLSVLLHKHRITTKVEIGGVLNNVNAFPITLGSEDFGILSTVPMPLAIYSGLIAVE
jgi:hypothetical protein